jgi:outer membrane receptor protein involved in Fe transport
MMRGGLIWRWSAASLLAWLLLSPTLAAAPLAFDVPAGPAEETLAQFARQAGIALAYPYELTAGRRTRALRGSFETPEALRLLLQGSGLTSRRDANGALVIDAARAPPRRARREREALAPDPAMATAVDEITVTGSRLESNGMTSVTPVTAIGSEDLELFGPVSLVDAMAQLPHFLNNDTPESQSFGSSAAAGASHLNLRGIGSIRTLTLVDGRRIVPSTRFGTIDLALLPRPLVRRVEVVTGGASAAYGSDAISGVANVLLDTGFDGLRVGAQAGITGLGDNPSAAANLLYGADLGEDSHWVFAAEALHADGIRGYASRPWFTSRAAIANPDPAGPREVIVDDVHATGYTYGGLITTGPLAGTQFLPGGATAPFVAGRYRTSATQAGGDGVDQAADLVWILPSQTRGSVFARLSTDFTSSLSAFVQMLAGYSQNEFGKDSPSLWGPWEATIYADNAFLPAEVRERMQGESFRLGRVAAEDLGSARVENRSALLSTTLGASWTLGDWNVDAYYQFGHNRNELRYHDAIRIDRLYRAIDSVVDPVSSRIVCRSTLSFPDDGCVPLNLFGVGSPSLAARDYVTEGSLTQRQSVDEHVAELAVQGEPFAFAAGAVRLAAGVNWRSESARAAPHRTPADLAGVQMVPASEQGYRGLPASYVTSTTLFERAVEAQVAGHYNVREAFAEAALPLWKAAHDERHLALNAALRYAHYTGSGTIAAWKAGAEWQLHQTLRLRATRSRDVRAGSLAERLESSSSGITVRDRFLEGTPSYAVISRREPNPGIDPEKGDTTTAGLVYQPGWSPGLALSVDYFDIRISDAISTLGVQNIIDRCHAGVESLCPLILRNEETGFIQQVDNRVLNISQARSRGVDVETSWRRALSLFGGSESIAIRLLGNYSLETSTTSDLARTIDLAGQTGQVGGSPRWQVNLSVAYRRDNLQLSIHEQLISSGIYSALNVLDGPGSIDDNSVGGVAYTNLRAEWRPAAFPGLSVSAHVANLFDRAPPPAGDWGFGGSIPTNESLFDALGRRYSIGLRVEL